MLQIMAFYIMQCTNGSQIQKAHLNNINPDEQKRWHKPKKKELVILKYKYKS